MADRKMFLHMSVKKYPQTVLEKTNLGCHKNKVMVQLRNHTKNTHKLNSFENQN